MPDKIFEDPWAMHENCRNQRGIYLEVQPVRFANGTLPEPPAPHHVDYLRTQGEGEIHYQYHDGGTPEEGKAINAELNALQDKWKRDGLSSTKIAIKRQDFISQWNRKKRRDEDSARQFWLEPGASTTTLAWAYGTDDPMDLSDEPLKAHGLDTPDMLAKTQHLRTAYGYETPVGDYTQLWSYYFISSGAGEWRIRAVYNYDVGYRPKELAASPWYVEAKTPFVDFTVLP